MLRIGFIGWRGMVGSVLLSRMQEEQDFKGFDPTFFTTSNINGKGPVIGLDIPPLRDAFDIDLLSSMDIILTCQGGDYTKKVYPEMRNRGWKGYWIDSASALRMKDDSIIVLDPVNRDVIDAGLSAGIKTYVGGNCTVSLMLMAISGLFASGHIEWVSSMTYQSASGAGARHMKELIAQMIILGDSSRKLLDDPASTVIAIDEVVTNELKNNTFPVDNFSAPLAASLIPWIDSAMESVQTKKSIPVDGLCVRVGAMRCHSQGLTIKLDTDIPLDEVSEMIEKGNEWVRLIPNDKESTLKFLTPAAVNSTLTIPVGRLRKMLLGPEYVAAFTVGDQLLWGAAEPIRSILNIIINYLS